MFQSVSLSAQFIFTRQFAALLQGRLQLAVALENLAAEMPKGKFRQVLDIVVRDVTNGRDMGDALADHPKVFGPIYVGVVRSGLRSGRIGEALEQLTSYLEQMDTFARKVRAAMTYPLFVLGAFVFVFHMMIFMILPRFEKLFHGMGRELPAMTQALVDLGHAYAENAMILIACVAIIGIGSSIWLSSEAGKIIWDAIKLKLPLIGVVVRLGALARLLRTVGMQLRHRIPAVEALRTGADAASNRQIAAATRDVAAAIERGDSFAGAFRREKLFGDVVVRMIAAGEQAGTLDQLMIAAADYFDTLLMQRINAVTAMINPLLTAAAGQGVAGMLVAAFLPVFELSGKVN
ncbi:MAG: type II secretion system F family protein [Alphaproteobacteria bacterium]